MKSGLYEGRVTHRRLRPRQHAFSYRVFMVHVFLDELPEAFDELPGWSSRRPALAWFRRKDHIGEPSVPLSETIRELVARRTGKRPHGRVSLLTHLRYFGYCMNPVSFYYCWDAADRTPEFVVAEINNTPWAERYCYVVECAQQTTGPVEFRKEFHVSPFMRMDQTYRWHFQGPEDTVRIGMTNIDNEGDLFHAAMALRARPLTAANSVRVLLRYPFMTAQVILAIYWQALRLWLKGIPFVPHPKHMHGVNRNESQ